MLLILQHPLHLFVFRRGSTKARPEGQAFGWIRGNGLFGEAGFHQGDQAVHCAFFVGAVGDDADVGAADNPQGQNAQQALRVDAALLLFHPDGGFEFIGFLDKESRGTGMQPHLILNQHIFYIHID